jgi:hypothetical protein
MASGPSSPYGGGALGAAAVGGLAAAAAAPGRMVAGQTSAPAGDDLKSKLKSSFSTGTKKRKPSQNGSQASQTSTRPAGAVKTKPKPAAQRSSLTSPSAHQDGAEGRRDAQLVLSRVEPWSVMKFSFMISLVGWIVLFVAIALLYYALRAFGVFHYLEQTVTTVTSSKGSPGDNAATWFSASTVLGYTLLAGAVNVVLLTALATVGSVIYNVVTHFSGGVEVTLREAD